MSALKEIRGQDKMVAMVERGKAGTLVAMLHGWLFWLTMHSEISGGFSLQISPSLTKGNAVSLIASPCFSHTHDL